MSLEELIGSTTALTLTGVLADAVRTGWDGDDRRADSERKGGMQGH